MAFDDGRFTFTELYVSAIVGLVVTFLLVAITEYYTGTRYGAREVDLGFARGTRRTSSRGSPSECRRRRRR